MGGGYDKIDLIWDRTKRDMLIENSVVQKSKHSTRSKRQ